MKKQKKLAILVVDDEEKFREELIDFLTEEGYRVTAVENGYQAIEEAGRQHFDLVILDLKMPGLDGFETCDGLHRVAGNIQMIMLTGNVSVKNVAESASKRIRDYIPKSSIDHLLEVIRRVLKETPVSRDASGRILTPPTQIVQTGQYLYDQHEEHEAATFWQEAGRVYKSLQIWESAAVNFLKAVEIWETKGQSLEFALDCFREAAEMFKKVGKNGKADALEQHTKKLEKQLMMNEKGDRYGR